MPECEKRHALHHYPGFHKNRWSFGQIHSPIELWMNELMMIEATIIEHDHAKKAHAEWQHLMVTNDNPSNVRQQWRKKAD